MFKEEQSNEVSDMHFLYHPAPRHATTHKRPLNTPEECLKLQMIVDQLNLFTKQNFRIVIKPSLPCIGLSMPDGSIQLSSRLLACSPSFIAFIVAHEWGHQMAGDPLHHGPITKETRHERELAADYFAAQFLALQEYDIDEVVAYITSTFLPGATHPPKHIRAEKLLEQYNDSLMSHAESMVKHAISSFK